MYNDTLLFDPKEKGILDKEFVFEIPDHDYLRQQRIAMGMSQQEVSEAAGINIRQYQRLEGGQRSMSSVSLRIGIAICDVLKLDPHRFVPGDTYCITLTPKLGTGYVKITRDITRDLIQGSLVMSLTEIASEKIIADLPGPFVFSTSELHGAPVLIQQGCATCTATIGLRGNPVLSMVLQDIEQLGIDMNTPTRLTFQCPIYR